jgi:hypothetical protein
MSEQTQESKVELQPDDKLPIFLTVPEIQGVLAGLRKFPMEQVENLVFNIRNQAEHLLEQMKPSNKTDDSTGETK